MNRPTWYVLALSVCLGFVIGLAFINPPANQATVNQATPPTLTTPDLVVQRVRPVGEQISPLRPCANGQYIVTYRLNNGHAFNYIVDKDGFDLHAHDDFYGDDDAVARRLDIEAANSAGLEAAEREAEEAADRAAAPLRAEALKTYESEKSDLAQLKAAYELIESKAKQAASVASNQADLQEAVRMQKIGEAGVNACDNILAQLAVMNSPGASNETIDKAKQLIDAELAKLPAQR